MALQPAPRRTDVATRSKGLTRSVEHARFMRRAMLSAFLVVFVSTVIYAVPWFSVGLTVEDYNNHMTILMFLVLAASVTAFGAVYLRDASVRVEQALFTWSSVHDGLSDLRRREYFFDRLVIECQRARGSNREFTVLALRLREKDGIQPDRTNIERVLSAIEPLLRESDCLAALGPHEIGAVAPRIDAANAASFVDSLKGLVAADEVVGSQLDIYAGAAVFGPDGSEAGALVGIARERMLRAMPPLPDEDDPARTTPTVAA